MKRNLKYFKVSILALTLLVLTGSFVKIERTSNSYKIEENLAMKCKYGQCTAIAKSTGKTCKHCVSNSGDKYCYQHD